MALVNVARCCWRRVGEGRVVPRSFQRERPAVTTVFTECVLFTDIARKAFAASVQRIETAGRTISGHYPATYVRDPDQGDLVTGLRAELHNLYRQADDRPKALDQLQAIQRRIRVADLLGAYWIIDETAQDVHAGHWGAAADGIVGELRSGGPARPSTDNASTLQAMIDWQGIIHRRTPRDRPVRIPPGVFRIGKGLRLGYGGYNSVTLVGAGKSFDPEQTGGTTLLCDFDDHPALAVSANLWGGARGLTLIGRARDWIERRELAAGPAATHPDDTGLGGWFDPARPSTDPALRYTPYAAIAVDPYHGAPPAGQPSYPEQEQPAWLEAGLRGTMYRSANGSSKPTFADLSIDGFAVGIVVQPGDFDQNGDFVGLRDCEIRRCGVGVSVGNTQSRNVHIERINFGSVHTALTTSMHGRRNGRLQGVMLNCSSSEVVQLLRLDNASAIWGPLTIDQFYGENLYVIGSVQHGPASTANLVFRGCSLGFNLQGAGVGERGIPLAMLWNPGDKGIGSGGGRGKIVFQDCQFSNFPTLLTLLQRDVLLDRCQVRGDYVDHGGDADLPKRWAVNLLAGGVVMPRLHPDHEPHRISHQVLNLDAAAGPSQLVMSEPGADWTSRSAPASLYCRSLSPRSGELREEAPIHARPYEFIKSRLAASAFDPDSGVWTFTVTSVAAEAMLRGFHAGAAIVDVHGFAFIVERVVRADNRHTVTAHLQNGYRQRAAGRRAYYERAFAHDAAEPAYIAGGGFYTPAAPTFFDTDGTPALRNFGVANRAPTIGLPASDELRTGDWLHADPQRDGWADGLVKVTDFPAAGQLTLAAATRGTAHRQRLWLVKRAPLDALP